MKKKTIAATIAVTLMAFSLTACGNTNVPNESADNTSVESVGGDVTETATDSVEESETTSEASETQASEDIGETEEMETTEADEIPESEEMILSTENLTTFEELWQFADYFSDKPEERDAYFGTDWRGLTPTDEMATIITVDGVEYNIFTEWGVGAEVTPDSQVSYDGLENPTAVELYNKMVENFGKPTMGLSASTEDFYHGHIYDRLNIWTGWRAVVPGKLGIEIDFLSDNTYNFRLASF